MLLFTLLTVLLTWVETPVADRGILKQEAPSWEVEKWFNLPEKKGRLDVTDFKGRVVYLYCFQSWCPGCHKYGFPTLKQVIKKVRR
ncbi:hypothetical protein GWO43_27040 [candidate division KSB1 bacterium]|nr:hypothetical protein [candidate division KSB1 bacterium]NIR70309.1 hypothetical protein [candidate division KSB1 bacterium]NIS27613.1 hypothetical protein [candidate division KSB1 bacterium]NIT74453.1 hypothetical protein [candidate division KSB1 bacterium]NIU28978.1 hypothetical protein [candidate division KSB1 bacterium]